LTIFWQKHGQDKVNLFSTSPNLCQCTTMWNTDASNCYISRW